MKYLQIPAFLFLFLFDVTTQAFTVSRSQSVQQVPKATTRNFKNHHQQQQKRQQQQQRNASPVDDVQDIPTSQAVNEIKSRLVRVCGKSPKPLPAEVKSLIEELEYEAEMAGIGQASAVSGLLSGEWELLYASTEDTRSSPFFWAFRKAFPDSADQIFGITDAIPAPLKEIGPAYQEIDMNGPNGGRFTSRVKVATLNGMATSIMTTRASILGVVGLDGIRLKIETTKPEKSTAISKLLGPLGDMVNENAPPFPSGEALERVMPGSSEVILRTTFCDEGLRISRNDARPDDEFFVWRRQQFASYENL